VIARKTEGGGILRVCNWVAAAPFASYFLIGHI
jgi:hypothetical protein